MSLLGLMKVRSESADITMIYLATFILVAGQLLSLEPARILHSPLQSWGYFSADWITSVCFGSQQCWEASQHMATIDWVSCHYHMKNIVLSVLTNGKPIEIEKLMVIVQLKTLPEALVWSQHFGIMLSLPPWPPDQIWSFGMDDMLCQLVTQGGTKAFVVLSSPLNPLVLYLQLLGPSLQL